MNRYPLIAGPTAGGKTDLALDLAEALDGRAEIISADAFQIYRGMDIGTAKPTVEDRRGIEHHLIDQLEPTEPFTVSDWLARAEHLIADIISRDRTPIVVGGTHLYVKAFLEGLFKGPDPDHELRERLKARGAAACRKELERVDPEAAARIHPNDERRTVRALEVFHQTGQPISARQSQWDAGRVRTDCALVGLEWPIDEINRRINERVRRMVAGGLLDEVRALDAAGRLGHQASQALGYKQLLDVIHRNVDLESAIERIKVETRRFAKNQRTWLRRLRPTPGSCWIDMVATSPEGRVEAVLQACNTPNE